MSLQDVKTLLGIESFDLDNQLTLIINMAEKQLLARINETAIPSSLDYIVTEVAIMRFNRLGSEGMQSESVEGHSITFGTSDFKAYESEIQAYIDKHNTSTRGVVRFL